MNDFAQLSSDLIGKLATMSIEEIVENKVDETVFITDTLNMTKEQFKQQHRQNRIAANDGMGVRIGQIMTGQVLPSFDNSAIWQLRDNIAREIAPEIRRRQLAWAGN